VQHNSGRSVPDAVRLPMNSPLAQTRSISRNLRAIHALGVREAAGRDQRIGARRVRGVDVVLLQYGVSERLSGRGPGVGDAWPSIAPKAGLSAPDRRSLSSRSPDGPRRPQPRCCSTSPKLRLRRSSPAGPSSGIWIVVTIQHCGGPQRLQRHRGRLRGLPLSPGRLTENPRGPGKVGSQFV